MLDAGQLRRAHMATVAQLLDAFSSLLAGDGAIDMYAFGKTSDEECAALVDERWPLLADWGAEGGSEEGSSEQGADLEYFPAGAGALQNLISMAVCNAGRAVPALS